MAVNTWNVWCVQISLGLLGWHWQLRQERALGRMALDRMRTCSVPASESDFVHVVYKQPWFSLEITYLYIYLYSVYIFMLEIHY